MPPEENTEQQQQAPASLDLDPVEVMYPKPDPIEGDPGYVAPEPSAEELAATAAAAEEAAKLEQETAGGEEKPTGEETPGGEPTGEETNAKSSEENQTEGGEEGSTGDHNISSFSELVESQGWDPEWADNLSVTTKVDGVESTVTIAEMRASHQTQEAATRRLDDAKLKAQKGTETLAKASDMAKGGLVQVAAILQAAEKLFGFEAAESDLKELRESGDNAAYLVAKEQLSDMRASIDLVRTEALKAFQTHTAQAAAPYSDDDRQEANAVQNGKLLELVPEWQGEANAEAYKTGATELVGYLKGPMGFTPEEIAFASGEVPGVPPYDARIFAMARKAMLYDAMQANVQAAEQTVKKIPKVMKPGANTNVHKTETPKDHAEVLYGKKTT